MDHNVYLKILKLFGSKGSRFTTEDLANELGTSKRTIYSYFSSKDEMIEKTIDFVFNDIIKSDTEIFENSELTIRERIELCLSNVPNAYNMGTIIQHMDDLQRYHPNLWEKVNDNLNTIWNTVIQLVDLGIKKGEFEEVDTVILKLILNESLKKLLDYEFIAKNQFSFETGIKAMNKVILYGLYKR